MILILWGGEDDHILRPIDIDNWIYLRSANSVLIVIKCYK